MTGPSPGKVFRLPRLLFRCLRLFRHPDDPLLELLLTVVQPFPDSPLRDAQEPGRLRDAAVLDGSLRQPVEPPLGRSACEGRGGKGLRTGGGARGRPQGGNGERPSRRGAGGGSACAPAGHRCAHGLGVLCRIGGIVPGPRCDGCPAGGGDERRTVQLGADDDLGRTGRGPHPAAGGRVILIPLIRRNPASFFTNASAH